ncbi:MAG: tetratricopeptide repeat protein [Zetaproteobacteria bacterium]|nr:MAG: tetratricopeptide repeat protein [Zetaproteobacteria bacterium]
MIRLLPLLTAALLAGCAATHEQQMEKAAREGELHYEMGVNALRSGDIPVAFRELMRAQKLRPDDAEVTAALALAWRLRGDLHKAEALYRKALAIKPTPAMHNNFGNLLLQMGRPAEAERQFRIALDDPRYTRQDLAFINLGDALAAQGRYDAAIAAYRKARIINPHQHTSRLREAEAFLASKRKPYAVALLLTMLRADPADREALQMVLPLLGAEQRPEAERLLRRFIEAATNEADRAWAKAQLR